VGFEESTRVKEVLIRIFVLPCHTGGIDEDIFIAEIVRRKARFFLRIGEGELERFREMADVGDGNLQSVFGGLN